MGVKTENGGVNGVEKGIGEVGERGRREGGGNAFGGGEGLGQRFAAGCMRVRAAFGAVRRRVVVCAPRDDPHGSSATWCARVSYLILSYLLEFDTCEAASK